MRGDALAPLGGRPPTDWSELRGLAVAARDLMPAVRSPIVIPGGAAGGPDTVMAMWLLIAAAGGGLGGAGPSTVSRSGTAALRFVRRLIDTGLMSPDVVQFDAEAALEELRSGRAVAAVLPRSLVNDPELLFGGLPGSVGSEMSTLVSGLVGVVMAQSNRKTAVLRDLVQLRPAQESVAPALLSGAHAPPVTEHFRALSAATTRVLEAIVSGSATVEAAMRDFGPIARHLGG